jgi:hypothetical protein
MFSATRLRHPLATLAIGCLASTTALAWSDGAISAWTTRNANLVAAVNAPIDAGAPPAADGSPQLYRVEGGFMYKPSPEEKAATGASGAYVTNIEDQCSGLTGELIKNGGRNMPVWAQTAQQKFCAGVKGLGTALVEKASDKTRCKELASAISYAQKAKPGDDPQVIVDSAAALMAAAEKLRSIPIVLTQKGRVLGDGSRTFACK